MREMKDSGIEFIGNIPVNWEIQKIKYLGEYRNGLTYSPSDLCDDVEGTLVLRSSNVKDGKLVLDDNVNVYVSCPIPSNLYVRNGDILICSRNGSRELIGKNACIGEVNASFGAFMMIYRCKYPRYMFYILNSPVFSYYLGTFFTTTINQLTGSNFGNMLVPYCPCEEERNRIVTYLDVKCSEIDALTADIQAQIDVLEQYKRSVITETVTKGLNPDAEMKDSGIEWIGKIPAHWKTIRIGRLFHLRDERNYKPLEEVQLLSLYTGIGVFPHGEQEERGNKAVTADGYKIVKANDIVVNIILAWMGAIGISNYDGVTSPAYDVYVPDLSKVVPHFFHYVFRTSGIAGECYKYGRGIMAMRWRTYSSEFKRIFVPYPDTYEQKQIADYLDTKCAEIDDIIKHKRDQLATIEEYKKSLIFEYVTGKKEV